jgi:hypothetical protein
MNHYSVQWIEEWCQDNGWTDLFLECSQYWAFPPQAVMPVPIPTKVLRSIKAQRGMCREERIWCAATVASAVMAAAATLLLASPMPLIASFAFCAVTFARMEEELA